ncbi:Neurogenic locus notch protein 2 [Mactra antiquata]
MYVLMYDLNDQPYTKQLNIKTAHLNLSFLICNIFFLFCHVLSKLIQKVYFISLLNILQTNVVFFFFCFFTDINECDSGPCKNGATCVDAVRLYICLCADGWFGTQCENNIDECYSNPCQNGQCNDLINGYTCTCDSSWTGSLCDTASCKSGWTYHDYSCYKIFNIMRNNPQAQVDCTLEAAHLVDVSSLSEMNFLQSLYYSSNLGGNTDFWISTNDQQYEGVYKLSDNTEATYFNWDPNGQPDQQYPEDDCVHVWINTNFKWNDVRCDYNYWFCCEYEI